MSPRGPKDQKERANTSVDRPAFTPEQRELVRALVNELSAQNTVLLKQYIGDIEMHTRDHDLIRKLGPWLDAKRIREERFGSLLSKAWEDWFMMTSRLVYVFIGLAILFGAYKALIYMLPPGVIP